MSLSGDHFSTFNNYWDASKKEWASVILILFAYLTLWAATNFFGTTSAKRNLQTEFGTLSTSSNNASTIVSPCPFIVSASYDYSFDPLLDIYGTIYYVQFFHVDREIYYVGTGRKKE